MQQDDLNALWSLYQRNVAANRQYSLRDCGLDVGAQTATHFVSSGKPLDANRARVQTLLARWMQEQSASARPEPGNIGDERKIFELCILFLRSADQVHSARFDELLTLGIPVNFQHPHSLETAMHIACSRNAANALTGRLLQHPETDFMLRDHLGRRPWNNAAFFSLESTLAEQVLAATVKQAATEGQSATDFHREYREDLLKWISTEWYELLARRKGDVWGTQQ